MIARELLLLRNFFRSELNRPGKEAKIRNPPNIVKSAQRKLEFYQKKKINRVFSINFSFFLFQISK